MKIRCLFLVFIISTVVITTAGQVRTVSNTDLEKFKQKRIAAEKELRENYKKLGFSSPEELARRNAQSAKEMQDLSDRLRSDRLMREQAETSAEQQRAAQARYNAYIRSQTYTYSAPVQNVYPDYWNYGYGGGYPGQYPRYPRYPQYPRYDSPAWRADGSGVVYEPGGRPSSIYTPVIRPRRPR